MSMKNSNDTIGNRTRDLPACSAVPQPITLPAACPLVMLCLTEIYTLFVLEKYIGMTNVKLKESQRPLNRRLIGPQNKGGFFEKIRTYCPLSEFELPNPQRNAAHMGSNSLRISFAVSIFFAHKKRTTPRCSIVVHVFRASPSCNGCYVCTVIRIPIVVRHNKTR
jgi:hypothetical protein